MTERIAGGDSRGLRRSHHAAIDAAEKDDRHHREGNASKVIRGSLRNGTGFSTGKFLAAGGDGDDDHLAQGHQQPRDDTAQEEKADRGIGDERVENHRDRGRDDRPDHGETAVRAAA